MRKTINPFKRGAATTPNRPSVRAAILAYYNGRPSVLNTTVVLCYPMAVFLFTYFVDHVRPGALWRNGWYDIWHDQSHYMKMLQSISVGSLGPFSYPPIYPFLGWLTAPLYPHDPFLPLNLAMFEVFTFLSWRLFTRCLQPGYDFAALMVLSHVSVKFFEIPWTSTVTATGVAVLMWIICLGKGSIKWGIVAGLWVGLIYGARMGDVVLGGALAAVAVAFAGRKNGVAFASSIALSAGAIIATVLLMSHLLTGLWFGHYFEAVRSQGFSLLSIPWRLYGYFIDAFSFHRETNPFSEPVWMVLPGLILAPAGFMVLWYRQRRLAIAVAVLCITWLITYGPFVAVTALSLKYGSVHYVKALFPALILCIFLSAAEFAASQYVARAILVSITLFVILFGTVKMMASRKIDPVSITFTASHNQALLGKAVDGNLTTRWDTGEPQKPGMSIDLDFVKSTWVNHISLDTTLSPNGFARRLSIWKSGDGTEWLPVVYSANQSMDAGIADYYIDPLRTRRLRLRLEQADADWWSIHELSVYGW
jgi:hypothetical protein